MLPPRALLIVIELIAATCAYGQRTVLSRAVPAIQSGQYPLQSLLLKVALSTGVPIGIEIVGAGPTQPQLYSGNEESISLENFLNAIIKKDGPYIWKENGGGINVFPKKEPSDVFMMEVESFQATDVLPMEMLQLLLKQSAIVDYLSQQRITAATWITGSVSPGRFSLSIRNLSLRTAINKIVIATGRHGWTAFYQAQNGKEYLWFQLW